MQAHAAELAAAIKAEEAELQLLQAQVWLSIQVPSGRKHAQLSRPVHLCLEIAQQATMELGKSLRSESGKDQSSVEPPSAHLLL